MLTDSATPGSTSSAVEPSIISRPEVLESAIQRASNYLLERQHPQGYWVFELEADCTIPSEYILMRHFIDDIDEALEAKIARYIRSRQNPDGSWPLYTGGEGDLSCTVKAYYALKLVGDDTGAPHLSRAREFILARGGAAQANVFTRLLLAMFGQIPWRGVPFIPAEIMLLPKWFPFHLEKVSYWSRTVMVPLLVLYSLKAQARNPKGVGIRELFLRDPHAEQGYFDHVKTPLGKAILGIERLGRRLEPLIPGRVRRRAIDRAFRWFEARLNGEDGLGAIFPAMVNAYEAMLQLGIPESDPRVVTARKAIDKLLVQHDDHAYCQPCVSPIWDTGLTMLTMQEVQAGHQDTRVEAALDKALRWLADRQIGAHDAGDWRAKAPDVPGGGWAFQFGNSYYPDVDDTAVVAYAMARAGTAAYESNLARAAAWLKGMQSSNGGFAAFDVDNCHYHLNHIPFADHGALLDPPSVDVSARCLMPLGWFAAQDPGFRPAVERCLAYLWREQESDGAWFGRWGSNYLYGTWSVLIALEVAGVARDEPHVRKAVEWLKSVQREDGGWGESQDSYADPALRGQFHISTAFQTAWALLGLMAAGEVESAAVRRGVDYLLRTQRNDGVWCDECFTAPGFPRVFYLKYHGYDKYFPLWALARYRNLHGTRCESV